MARRRSAAMSAPAPLLGEKQTSGGRLAATDFMSTHPNPPRPPGRLPGLVHAIDHAGIAQVLRGLAGLVAGKRVLGSPRLRGGTTWSDHGPSAIHAGAA
jgi:hypothetical protein